MDETMEVILTNLEQLIPIINGDLVADLIAYRGVLTEDDWETIKGKEHHTKTESLLLAIGNRGPDALYALKDILAQIENYRAVEILNTGRSANSLAGSSESPYPGGYGFDGDDDIFPISQSVNKGDKDNNGIFGGDVNSGSLRRTIRTYSGCDDGDGELDISAVPTPRISSTDGSLISSLVCGGSQPRHRPEHQILVKAGSELKEGENIYPVKSLPRGICLLINNVDFTVFEARKSAEEDGVFLSSVFQQLGFVVHHYKNQGAQLINETLQQFSKKEELKEHDAFVCIIMSHGQKKDLIVGSDGLFIRLESLLAHFNNFNCPNLINKPKLFFIQACRGEEYDYGILDPHTTADAAPIPGPVTCVEEQVRIPTWGDMCIVHSTLQGYVAFRHIHSGSWFAEALGWALIDHACDKSLHELLMVVSHTISKREGKGKVKTKQAIEVVWRGWNKHFFFNPGFYIQ